MKFYLAAPLFTPHERDLNLKITKIIEANPNHEVFLPQRDGFLLTEEVKIGNDIHEIKEKIFQKDIRAIENSDIIFAILNGRVVDEGVAFEMGYGCARGLNCWAYKNDWRQLLESGDNPMIEGAINRRFDSLVEIENYFHTYISCKTV